MKHSLIPSLRRPLALLALVILSACAAPGGNSFAGKPATDLIPLSDAEYAQKSGNLRGGLVGDIMLADEVEAAAYAPGHGGYPEYLQRMQKAFDTGRFKMARGANISLGGRTDYVGKGGPRYANGTPPSGGAPAPANGRAAFEQELQRQMSSGKLHSQEMTITYPDGTRRTIKP